MSDAPRTSGMTRLRNYFLTGFIVCAPLAITVYSVWSLVFVASEKETEINQKLDQEGDPLIAVFMPCTPNPTTGFLMYVLKSDIVLLDMTIEDGAKLIVSAGLVAPEVRTKMLTVNGEPINGTLANPPLGAGPQPARSSRIASSRPNK